MEFIKNTLNIPFMRYRMWGVVFSTLVSLICVGSLYFKGLNFGLDFTGGTLVEVAYQEPVALDKVRADLTAGHFDSAMVQHYGSSREVMIRLAPNKELASDKVGGQLLEALSANSTAVELRRVEYVGPQVGEELTEDGGLAVLYTLFAILVYVALRFEFRFALGSIIALAHDVLITVGFFSLTGLEFDLTVLAAVLAVLGYSINDSIVVFDRIRENFRRVRKGTTEEIVDLALNETLSRTIMTGITTLLVLLALVFFGGTSVFSFSLALIVGILFGTYSSVYVASSAALMLGVSKEDLMPVAKEGAELDKLP